MDNGYTKRRRGRSRIVALHLASALLVLIAVAERSARAQAARGPRNRDTVNAIVGVVVPEREIRAGAKLSDTALKVIDWPSREVPAGAVRDMSEISEQFAKVSLQPGVPIRREQLSKEPSNVMLPLTPGNRMVEVEIDDVPNIDQHAILGSHVSVVVTFRVNGELTSKEIVHDARILSYSRDATPSKERFLPPGFDPPLPWGRTVTLDVAPNDGLTIQTVRMRGRLSLVMLAREDCCTAPFDH